MIAYFAPLTTAFMQAVAHKLMYHHDDHCVLFIHGPVYKSKNLFFLKDKLKENGIFDDVIAESLICDRSIPEGLPNDTVEKKIVDHFDAIFDRIDYSVDDFSEIFALNDNHDADFAVYLNINKIRYTWVQIVRNVTVRTHPVLNRGYFNVLEKYKATSPFAEYADPCFRSDSVIPATFADKEYTTWDCIGAISNISDEDMNKLYKCFGLDDFNWDFIKDKVSTLIIQNSYGLLSEQSCRDRNKKKATAMLGYYDYSWTEIFSAMDKLSIDFFVPDTECVYLKAHINEKLNQQMITDAYGNDTILLPNVHFQILGKYLAEHNIKFTNVLSTCSTSLDGVTKAFFENEYAFGINFARTWWFYSSLYAVVLFAKFSGYQSISSTPQILEQIQKLADTMGYTVKLTKLDKNKIAKIKNTLFIFDLSKDPISDLNFGSIDKSNIFAFLNEELSDGYLMQVCKKFLTPLCIKKDKLSEQSCDVLLRNETVWIYSTNSDIRRKARSFKFQRTLKFLGVCIHTDGISYPDLLDFISINTKLQKLTMETEHLKRYIQSPDTLISELKRTNDINAYLDILNILKDKYMIILAVRDTPGNNLSQEVIDKIHEFGFTDFSSALWQMYVGMVGKGNVICNAKAKASGDPIGFTGFDVNTGTRFVLRSQAWQKGDKAEIIIGGKNYAANIRGLNLVVYDSDNQKVIDSVGFDNHETESRFIRKDLSN